MRIAVLWQSMSGYFSACLRALATQPGIDLCLAFRSAQPVAPFDPAYSAWINPQYAWNLAPNVPKLEAMLAEFDPDAILVSSWHIGGYRASLKRPRRTTNWDKRPRHSHGRVREVQDRKLAALVATNCGQRSFE